MKNLSSIIQEKLRIGKSIHVNEIPDDIYDISKTDFVDLLNVMRCKFKIITKYESGKKYKNIDNWYYICMVNDGLGDNRTFYKSYKRTPENIRTAFSANEFENKIVKEINASQCMNFSISEINSEPYNDTVIAVSLVVRRNNSIQVAVLIFAIDTNDIIKIHDMFVKDNYDDVKIDIQNLI